MKLRRINNKRLIISGICYRLNVMIAQFIFYYLLTGDWKLAFKGSFGWLILGTLVYYNYHYWFARLIKIGRN